MLYLVGQGVGTFVWWAAMRWSDDVRSWFVGDEGEAWDVARTLVLADIALREPEAFKSLVDQAQAALSQAR